MPDSSRAAVEHELHGCFLDIRGNNPPRAGGSGLIARDWTRRRYQHKSPSDLHYIVVGIILLVSAGIGMLVASYIVVAIGYMG
jgi:hypothetical protein